ncbi:MAG TPA: NFACT RNA binding domain-containing protein [Sphaerochaeta sp.]|nr:NFACT RNA binding domain-containing protein [Sphaerochaeta sp.]
MSLNWREIALIISELPLEGSAIQKVVQHDFNSLSWELYRSDVRRWILYTEVGTPYARLHLLSEKLARKTDKLQRFIQFSRAHLIGCRITEVYQFPFDRLIRLRLERRDEIKLLYIRLYSGSGANIIVTDEENRILDLLFRRPKRNEVSGEILELEPLRTEEGKVFAVRERTESSFNRQIEVAYDAEREEADIEQLLTSVRTKRDRELQRLAANLISAQRSEKTNATYQRQQEIADLLSANAHLLHSSAGEIELYDWHTDEMITIALDSKRHGHAHIEAAYSAYHRAKGAYERASSEVQRLGALIAEREAHYEDLFTEQSDSAAWSAALQTELATQEPSSKAAAGGVGLTIQSGEHTLLVGRNAKENDRLLRDYTRGNDWWMHTRDYSGGYVFIKDIRGKSVPLETLLDAATLAIHYSKARKEGKADLYYTQVKYLRRAKGAKLGTVLPTQEKNLSVVLDEERLRRLLLEHDDA